ncbi:SusD/RagB family nutrient-binding outer membrane lipoprotein [Prevotella sp. P6B1]|uniref:SusD/RagB family nutrient-binding outer membrane lipoprotein n=1 Tax=Prevotella sp. P6B1 TaxID=1410613 RepID=UPI00051B90DD|nr:SusD/RagB family nutrient-binding outer membrane lipoprotein [Prevotella sp. P6B1]
MKKIYLFAAGLMMLASCDMDINENPNYPSSTDITPSLQFPAVVNAVAATTGDQMFNYAGFFVQYWDQMPEANQYNDLAELNIDETKDLINRGYRTLYAGALQDIKDIQGKTTNTADLFACQVMRTQIFQILVDNTDQTPYTEALQASANSTPKYDEGKAVYEGVLAELDEAQAAIQSSDLMTMTDPMLKKNVNQWIGYANALRLRMYLRLIDGGVNAAEYTSKVKALVAAGNFFTGDVAWDVYTDQEGQFNPWYAGVFSLANNHCAGYALVEYYKAMNDPRLGYAYNKRSSDNTYVGQLPGSKQEPNVYSDASSRKNSAVSALNYGVTHDMAVYLFTQSELQFLIAEVELRFNNNTAAAKAAYEKAVTLDFTSRGVAGAADFLTADGSFDNADDQLELIYLQKWAALFLKDHLEAWSEVRRTDVPKLSAMSAAQVAANPAAYTPGQLIAPGRNYFGNGNIAMSIPYSSDSRKYNVNTPKARAITDKVFWDVK